MWRGGPRPGALITADPATVEWQGFFIRFLACFCRLSAWCRLVDRAKDRKSHWSGIVSSRGGRLLIYESSISSRAERSGKAREPVVVFLERRLKPRARKPAIRAGHSPNRGKSAASTEVVMAPKIKDRSRQGCRQSIRGLFFSRPIGFCKSVHSDG